MTNVSKTLLSRSICYLLLICAFKCGLLTGLPGSVMHEDYYYYFVIDQCYRLLENESNKFTR